MADVFIPIVKNVFGDEATYAIAETGATVSVSAISTRSLVVPNGLTGVNENRTVIEIPTVDLAGIIPRRGDTVTIGTERWVVLARDSDDGYLTRLIVRPGDG